MVRILGGLCALVVAAVWVWTWVAQPFGAMGVAAPAAMTVTIIFVGLALAGVGAVVKDVPLVLALIGLFSMVPGGIYLILYPGPTRLIGWCDLGMLAAGIWMVVLDRRAEAREVSRSDGAHGDGGGP